MSTEAFEGAKSFLQKSEDGGVSMYDHLTDVLVKLIKDQPADALKNFEALSAGVRAERGDGAVAEKIQFDEETKKALLAHAQKLASVLKPAPKNDEDEEEEPVDIPDLLAEASILKEAGVDLGDEDIYQLSISISKLAAKEGFETTRFFGKIFGTEKDYFIVEAKLKEYPEVEEVDPNSKTELPGQGANSFVYFASNSVSGSWTKLPDVLPEQIQISRQMRRFFTGNLEASVPGYPQFKWSEASYLRAQVARISASTLIAPQGFYTLDEEEEEPTMIKDEEYKGPEDFSSLSSTEGWSHFRAHILNQGRCVKWEKPEAEDEEEEENNEEEEEVDEEEPVEILRSLESDEVTSLKVWSFRSSAKHNPSLPHPIIAAKNQLWPGATTVARGSSFVNVYVGFGQKYLKSNYSPPAIPAVQNEFVVPEPEDEEEEPVMKEQVDPLPPPPKENEDDAEGEDEEDEE